MKTPITIQTNLPTVEAMKLQKQLQALHDDLGSDGIKKLLSKYETSAVTKTAVQMAAK